jgi:hypothetical protein
MDLAAPAGVLERWTRKARADARRLDETRRLTGHGVTRLRARRVWAGARRDAIAIVARVRDATTEYDLVGC